MNDTLKRLVASGTALRLLLADLRASDPADFDYTGISIRCYGMLSIQVGSEDEAAPFLAVMAEAEWTSDNAHDDDHGYHQRIRRGGWAGTDVELVVCYRLPDPESDPGDVVADLVLNDLAEDTDSAWLGIKPHPFAPGLLNPDECAAERWPGDSFGCAEFRSAPVHQVAAEGGEPRG